MPRVEIPDEGIREWENATVAQFLGKVPNYSAFQKVVKLMRGEDVDLRPAGKNLFIVLFDKVEARDRILKKGPWHIKGQPLIVKKLAADLENLEIVWKKLPVWV